MLAAAARYGNVLDYAGPNLASNELALHGNRRPMGRSLFGPNGNNPSRRATPSQAVAPAQLRRRAIAKGLGAQLIALETPNAGLNGIASGP